MRGDKGSEKRRSKAMVGYKGQLVLNSRKEEVNEERRHMIKTTKMNDSHSQILNGDESRIGQRRIG